MPFPIGASIGIATYPEDGRSATDLLAVADRGLYDAKAAGGNRVGPDPEAAARSTWTPMSRRPSSSARTAGGPANRSPADAGRRAAGGSGAVEWGLSQYGSTRTRRTDSTGGPALPRAGRRPHARTQVSLRNSATGDLRLRTGLRDLTRRPFVLTFVALGTIELLRVVFDPQAGRPRGPRAGRPGRPAGHPRAGGVADAEGSRRTEAESFARILRALSRSVSPDAIVAAIVEELGAGTGADHVAVVRRRPEGRVLEAVLSSTRPGAPTSRTSLPLSGARGPGRRRSRMSSLAIAASRGRRLTAVPIEPDPDGDPQLVPLGIAADRLARSGARHADGHGGRARAGAAPAWRRCPFARAGRRTPRPRATAPTSASPTASPTRVADAYGLSQRARRAAPRRRPDRGRDRRVAPDERAVARQRPPHPRGRRRRRRRPPSPRVYSLREAEARASTDALTGLPNRRYFDEYLGLLAKRRRAEDRVGVLMIDIDRFKKLNDTFGHAVGDHVLREVARAIAEAVREDDVPARFGGEEFAVLLRNPSPEIAVEVGERVRRAVSSLDLRRLGVPGRRASRSAWRWPTSPDVALDVVIDEADRALYRAKREGRDRVVAA